jgi:hypothetical protein
MLQKHLLAYELHRVALPIRLLVVILLVFLKERGGHRVIGFGLPNVATIQARSRAALPNGGRAPALSR